MRLVLSLTFSTLALFASVAHAAPAQNALTVYGEPPKYPANFTHFDYANPDAPKGGSLKRSAIEIGQFDHVLPYIDKGIGVSQVDGWIYSPLAVRSLDEPYTVYGLVAEKMQRADDGLSLRFFLNPKARFADNTPITAEDVRYTFNLLMTEGSLSYRMQFEGIKDVVVESPTQVRFDFRNTENRSLPLDIATLPVLPEHWWKTRDFADGGGYEAPLGSGPYRVSKVDSGRSITFARNPDWWGKDLPVSRGLYNFDRFSIEYPRLCVQPAKTDVPGSPRAPGPGHALGLRVEQPADDAQHVPAPAELLLQHPAGEPLRGQIPDEVFTQVFEAPKTDASGNLRDKQLQALALLEQAGWKPKGDQLVNAQGEPLSFTFLNAQNGMERLLLPYKRNLAQIGIRMDIRRIDPSQYVNRLKNRDYDMIVSGYPVTTSPGIELYNFFGSSTATDPGSNNFMALQNPAVDSLINGLVKANTQKQMLSYAHALDRVLQWNYYWIPNYYPPGISTVWWNRFGIPQIQASNDAAIETWWEVSPTPLTNEQMTAELIRRGHDGGHR